MPDTLNYVPENIALDKPTFQSSELDSGGESFRAVDGDESTVYGNGSCTHTRAEVNPWWAVDLLSYRLVERV